MGGIEYVIVVSHLINRQCYLCKQTERTTNPCATVVCQLAVQTGPFDAVELQNLAVALEFYHPGLHDGLVVIVKSYVFEVYAHNGTAYVEHCAVTLCAAYIETLAEILHE